MIEAFGEPGSLRNARGLPPAIDGAGRAEVDAASRQQQKADAVGHLVGGLAHDFNNLLGVIIGNLDRASRLMAVEAAAFRHITDALSATDRAVALVCRLLAFVRPQPMLPALVEIDQLLIGLKPLLDIAAPGCVVTLHLGRVGYGLIAADQLENAILNLAVNAHDAMPRGGMLTVTTRIAMKESVDAAGNRSVRDYVVVEVSDTGTGMSPEVRDKVGERFFTTKGEGRGTGLGFAQVLAFVNACGGSMHLTSEVGRGTSVALHIPRASIAPA